ncbi:MAG: patatin-like phospholipase family protein [Polyangia bacterium]
MLRSEPRIGLVLPGGAALGAYEAGVVDYLVRDIAAEIGAPLRFDVLAGTSVGAIGATMLAAFADDPAVAAERLLPIWTSLRVDRFLRPDVLGALVRWCGGRAPNRRGVGGVLNVGQIEQVIRAAIPFERIAENLRRGHLSAVSVSTTHVASGHTVVFVQSNKPITDWSHDRTLIAQPALLTPEHLLASAAIPLLVPAIPIDGELYCEGGLRQNVPLSPALHLGSDRLLVVSPHYAAPPDARLARARERAISGPVFLLGRMLNALLLDRIDADLERLQQINEILAATTPRPTPRLPRLRIVEPMLIRSSRSIGKLAAEFVRSRRFAGRGLIGRLLKQIAAAEGTAEADLVSYLLFDGDFAAELIALGRSDARAQHDALCALFAPAAAAKITRPAAGG